MKETFQFSEDKYSIIYSIFKRGYWFNITKKRETSHFILILILRRGTQKMYPLFYSRYFDNIKGKVFLCICDVITLFGPYFKLPSKPHFLRTCSLYWVQLGELWLNVCPWPIASRLKNAKFWGNREPESQKWRKLSYYLLFYYFILFSIKCSTKGECFAPQTFSPSTNYL